MAYVLLSVYIILTLAGSLLVGVMGRKRTAGFWPSFAFSVVLTPFIGYFLLTFFPFKASPRICYACNVQAENEFCPQCGTNVQGFSAAYYQGEEYKHSIQEEFTASVKRNRFLLYFFSAIAIFSFGIFVLKILSVI